MILPDGESTDSSSIRKSSRPGSVNGDSQSTHSESLPPYAPPLRENYNLEGAVLETKRRQRRRRRRRLAFAIVAFFVYTGGLIALLVEKPWKKNDRPPKFNPSVDANFDPYQYNFSQPIDNFTAPFIFASPGDNNAVSCNTWQRNSPQSATITYSYDASNMSTLYINSFANNAVDGSLNVLPAQNGSSEYTITIESKAKTEADPAVLNVCMLKGAIPGSYGLGIYNATNNTSGIDASDQWDVSITMVVPRNLTMVPINTFLPCFDQFFGRNDLEGRLTMSNAYIDGTASHLEVYAVSGRKLALRPQQAFIGDLQVSEQLLIYGNNAAIYANITLQPTADSSDLKVAMVTDSAPVKASVIVDTSLLPPNISSVDLNVTASTSWAPLHLGVEWPAKGPVVILNGNATTALAPLTLELPHAYQGTFEVLAASSKAVVNGGDTFNPRLGMYAVISHTSNNDTVRGVVFYDPTQATIAEGDGAAFPEPSDSTNDSLHISALYASRSIMGPAPFGRIQGSTFLAPANITFMDEASSAFSDGRFLARPGGIKFHG